MNDNLISIKTYKESLLQSGYSSNTIRTYCNAVKSYYAKFDELNQMNLISFREILLKQSPSTANVKIIAINKYLSSIHSSFIPLKCIKNPCSTYVENVITNDEYSALIDHLKRNGRPLYYCVRLMSSTGMRISEVLKVSYVDIKRGFMDVSSKGNKIRRVYFTNTLQQEYYDGYKESTPVLFPNKSGKKISPSGIRFQLKKYGSEIGIQESHLHPHAFRHLFAINFIQNGGDLTMLSDILGHESIETTRIYLKKSSEEQHKIINELVTW